MSGHCLSSPGLNIVPKCGCSLQYMSITHCAFFDFHLHLYFKISTEAGNPHKSIAPIWISPSGPQARVIWVSHGFFKVSKARLQWPHHLPDHLIGPSSRIPHYPNSITNLPACPAGNCTPPSFFMEGMWVREQAALFNMRQTEKNLLIPAAFQGPMCERGKIRPHQKCEFWMKSVHQTQQCPYRVDFTMWVLPWLGDWNLRIRICLSTNIQTHTKKGKTYEGLQ